jgi:hypothetical protein
LATLLAGPIACATICPTTPKLGPPFIDKELDPAGSAQRHAEFDAVCSEPQRKGKAPLLPGWCAWTPQADQVIRANNAKAGRKNQKRAPDGAD